MPLKEDITIAAILGTGRQAFRAPQADGALGALLGARSLKPLKSKLFKLDQRISDELVQRLNV